MAPVLYKMDASPPSRTVMMVADILGIKLDQRDLNPVIREQDTPEFKKKNPMKSIPILEDENFYLGDSHAICLYLIDKYGKPEHSQLYPAHNNKRALVNQILFFDCGVLWPRLRSIMAPTYGGRLTELSKTLIKNVDDGYEMLEMYLSDNLYLAGNDVTLADLCVLTTISTLNGLHPVNENRCPKLKEWLQRMNEKDYSKRINEPGSKEHVDGLLTLMQFNKQKLSKL